jgi:hypothetical protein
MNISWEKIAAVILIVFYRYENGKKDTVSLPLRQ